MSNKNHKEAWRTLQALKNSKSLGDLKRRLNVGPDEDLPTIKSGRMRELIHKHLIIAESEKSDPLDALMSLGSARVLMELLLETWPEMGDHFQPLQAKADTLQEKIEKRLLDSITSMIAESLGEESPVLSPEEADILELDSGLGQFHFLLDNGRKASTEDLFTIRRLTRERNRLTKDLPLPEEIESRLYTGENPPSRGDWIYLEGKLYIERGECDLHGGLAQVRESKTTFVHTYQSLLIAPNWSVLRKKQVELRETFGYQFAYPDPDVPGRE